VIPKGACAASTRSRAIHWNVPIVVEVFDPVSGYYFVMDDITHVAHRSKLGSPPHDPPPPKTSAGAVYRPGTTVRFKDVDRFWVERQYLEPKTVNGVLLEGTKMIEEIPAGARDNDRAFQITTEVWWSPVFRRFLFTTESDPYHGITTTHTGSLT